MNQATLVSLGLFPTVLATDAHAQTYYYYRCPSNPQGTVDRLRDRLANVQSRIAACDARINEKAAVCQARIEGIDAQIATYQQVIDESSHNDGNGCTKSTYCQERGRKRADRAQRKIDSLERRRERLLASCDRSNESALRSRERLVDQSEELQGRIEELRQNCDCD